MLNYIDFIGDTDTVATYSNIAIKTALEVNIKSITLYTGSRVYDGGTKESVTFSVKIGDTVTQQEVKEDGHYVFELNHVLAPNTDTNITITSSGYALFRTSQNAEEISCGGLVIKAQTLPTIKIAVESEIDEVWNIGDLYEGYPYITGAITPVDTIKQNKFVDETDLLSLLTQYGDNSGYFDTYKEYVYKINPLKFDGYPYIWIPLPIEEIIGEGYIVYTGEKDNKYQQRLVYINNKQYAVYIESEAK